MRQQFEIWFREYMGKDHVQNLVVTPWQQAALKEAMWAAYQAGVNSEPIDDYQEEAWWRES